MTLCGEQSASCKKYLGDYPMEQVAMLMELAASGKQNCTQHFGFSATSLRNSFGSLLMMEDNRILIPAIVKRLLYCSATDQQELKHMAAYFLAQANLSAKGNSSIMQNDLLGNNIALSEMYSMKQPPNSAQYFQDLDESLFMSVDVSILFSEIYSQWPRYNPNNTVGYNEYPTAATTPLLLIEGELDPQTSHAWSLHAMDHYKQGQEYYSVPYAPHGAFFFSPYINSTVSCGMKIATSWLLHGKADTSCLSTVLPPDFEGTLERTKTLSNTVFGTTSLWGN